MIEAEDFLEQLNIDPKKFVTVRGDVGASSGSFFMIKDLLKEYAKLTHKEEPSGKGLCTSFTENEEYASSYCIRCNMHIAEHL